ncbi:oligoendopeptidase F, partial [bacterium]|nr:oligoendopeptidase F [bacterium]
MPRDLAPHHWFRLADTTGGNGPRERHELDPALQWRIDRIFPGWDAWDETYEAVDRDLETLAALRGTLADGPAALRQAIETIHGLQRRLEVVSVYATMRSDEDTRIGENTARRGRAGSLATRFAEAVSWFEPELLALDDAVIDAYLADDEALRLYAHFLDDLRRMRRHTLDPEREALLAAAGNITRAAGRVFSALTDADMTFGEIEDEDGRTVSLSHARYYRYIRSHDRRVRRDTFESYLDAYGEVRNTLAANLDAQLKNHVFRAEARRYDGCLHAALHPDAVPVSVYH